MEQRQRQIIQFALNFLIANLDDAIEDTSYDFTEKEIQELINLQKGK